MWPNIPSPPSPTGINQFPNAPSSVVVYNQSIPNQDAILKYTNLNLKIEAQWKLVVSATATPATPFSQSVSVTTGSSSTKTNTQEFSGSFGLISDFFSIGAKVSDTISESVTISVSDTVSEDFGISPKNETVTACWWQLYIKYTITGEYSIPGIPGTFKPTVFNAVLDNGCPTYISTTYPANPNEIITGLK